MPLKGRINHSVVFWCFNVGGEQWDLEKTCRIAKDLGCKSIEIVGPETFPTLKQHGLVCALAANGMPGAPFMKGFNNLRYHDEVIARHELVRDYDFDPVGKHMSHVWREAESGLSIVAAKGAIEGVLAHVAADDPARQALAAANEGMAARGLRVLAIAGRRGGSPGATRDDDERDLVVQGLVGFQDPLRPEVPDAVAECNAPASPSR